MLETYIPLYRKYRPQSFADLVGQEAVAQALGNAIKLNKIAHAYLLTGPRGTGKTSTARIFAKSLNCAQGPTVSPCQACPSCTGIAQGSALDIIEFDAASNNGVDDARELIESCQFAPIAGKFKIYIIDEVHMLSTAAFNALLKTLEEPPPNIIFLFATTEAHKVLPTIISRCQRFDFHRVTTEAIAARLRYIAGQEGILIDDESVRLIARHARGGLRDAVGLLDQVGVLSRSQPGYTVTRDDVLLFIGTLAETVLLDISAAIATKDVPLLAERLHGLANHGVEPSQMIKDLTHHFRNLLMVKASKAAPADVAEALDLSQPYVEALAVQAKDYETEELPQILQRLADIERDMRMGQEPQLWLEVGLVGIAYRESIHRVAELAERVERLEARLAAGPPIPAPAAAMPPRAMPAAPPQIAPPPAAMSPAMAPAPVIPAAPPPMPVAAAAAPVVQASAPAAMSAPVVSDGVGDEWAPVHHAICNAIASPALKELMRQQAFIVAVEPDRVVFGCPTEAWLNKLQLPDRLIHIKKAVEKHFGAAREVAFRLEKKRVSAAAPSAQVATPAPISQAMEGLAAMAAAATAPQLPPSDPMPLSSPPPMTPAAGPPPLHPGDMGPALPPPPLFPGDGPASMPPPVGGPPPLHPGDVAPTSSPPPLHPGEIAAPPPVSGPPPLHPGDVLRPEPGAVSVAEPPSPEPQLTSIAMAPPSPEPTFVPPPAPDAVDYDPAELAEAKAFTLKLFQGRLVDDAPGVDDETPVTVDSDSEEGVEG